MAVDEDGTGRLGVDTRESFVVREVVVEGMAMKYRKAV